MTTVASQVEALEREGQVPHSQKQVRYAHAVIGGKARKRKGMPLEVAREIVGKMHNRKMNSLPKRAY